MMGQLPPRVLCLDIILSRWWTSRPKQPSHRERPRGTHSTGSSLDPAQNVLERGKISFPCRKSNHHYSFFWYIAPLLYRLSNPGSWISSYSPIKFHWQSKKLWRISTVHMVKNLKSIKQIVTWTFTISEQIDSVTLIYGLFLVLRSSYL